MGVVVLVLIASLAHAEPTVAVYDAGTSDMQQCSEGPQSYMHDCVFPSDFFTYILMNKPTITKGGVTCESMGYSLLNQDPIFVGFKQYWKGNTSAEAHKNFAAWLQNSFNVTGHAELVSFLKFTRDHNPSCSPRKQPIKALELEDKDDTPSAYFDACGKSAQCADGKYSYLQNCVKPSDYFAYMNSRCPVIVKKTCAELGYELVENDPIFDFKIYWKGGPKAANKFFAAYSPGHPDNVKFINKTKLDNPSCRRTSD